MLLGMCVRVHTCVLGGGVTPWGVRSCVTSVWAQGIGLVLVQEPLPGTKPVQGMGFCLQLRDLHPATHCPEALSGAWQLVGSGGLGGPST